MTMCKNPRTGLWEADLRHAGLRRLHISLGVSKKQEATPLYAAVRDFYLGSHAYPDLLDRLRKRSRERLTVRAIRACVDARQPFTSLRVREQWPTLAEAITGYLAWLRAHPRRSANTVRIAAHELSLLADAEWQGERLTALRVDRVPTAAVEAWAAALAARYAANTVTQAVVRLGAVYTWLRRQEDRDARASGRAPRALLTPLDPDTQPRETTRRERFLSLAECEALVRVTLERAPSALLPLHLGLHAGLRRGEVVHLRREDLDLTHGAHGFLAIRARETPHPWRPKTKNGARVIPLTRTLRAVLDAHLAAGYAGEVYLVSAARKAGQPLNTSVLGQVTARLVRAAGMTPGRGAGEVSFHTLRHTFASHAAMRGVDLVTLSDLLGDRLETVRSTYLHLCPDHKAAAVATVSDLGGTPTLAPPRLPIATTSARHRQAAPAVSPLAEVR